MNSRQLAIRRNNNHTCELLIILIYITTIMALFCALCVYQTPDPAYLNRHMAKIHLKPFECHVCQKRLTIATLKSHHKRIHQRLVSQKCDVCLKKFDFYANPRYTLLYKKLLSDLCNDCVLYFTFHK